MDLTAYVEKHEFVFDAVLNQQVSNDEVRTLYFGRCTLFKYKIIRPFTNPNSLVVQVYRSTVEPIVPTIFNRTKATCFAYGQTGPTSIKFYLFSHYVNFVRLLKAQLCEVEYCMILS